DFMRKASKEVIKRIDEVLKPEVFKKLEQDPKKMEELRRVQGLRMGLESTLRAPRYFESGVKIDDLVDFKLWLAEADRLNIDLTIEAVKALVRIELVRNFKDFYPPEIYRTALLNVRSHYNRASEDLLNQTLRDEFRVQ